MSIFTSRAKSAEIQELRKQTALLEKQVGQYRQVQEKLVKDILTLQEVERSYVGNEYRDYAEAVDAIAKKYRCVAEWGVLTTGICINLRAAFILGEGVEIKHTTDTRAEAENELKWAKDFFTYNALDAEMTQEIAKETEIEGKCALRIAYDPEPDGFKGWPGMTTVRFLSWATKRYKVEADPMDYLWYKRLKWEAKGTDAGGVLEEPEFVYKKFGGRINDPNDAQPAVMRCLTQIDRLDKALRDLREIMHLFASPTPVVTVETAAEIETVTKRLQSMNWKIGKLLVTNGTMSMVSPDAGGVDMLLREIEMNIKMISGATGIPIHFLGLLDLLRNRATGDNTRELVMAATARERMIWKGAFDELLEKGMKLYNAKVNAQKSRAVQLDPSRVECAIPLITQEHWDRIEKVLIPAAQAKIISNEHVAGQIPGVDLEQEASRRTDAAEAEAERGRQEMALLVERMRQPVRVDDREGGPVA